MMNPREVEVVYYHSPCSDGTTSAAIAMMYLGHPTLIPLRHPVIIKDEDIKGKNVLFVDISPPTVELALHIIDISKKCLFLDHHATAVAVLKDIPPEYKKLDMNKCGATLAWDYFFPLRPPPLFVEYAEDIDLARHHLAYSKAIQRFLYHTTQDPAIYKAFIQAPDMYGLVSDLSWRGDELEVQDKILAQIELKSATQVSQQIRIGSLNMLHMMVYISPREMTYDPDVFEAMFDQYPEDDVMVIVKYNEREDMTYFSIRSKGHDLVKICESIKNLPGVISAGGHKRSDPRAAGVQMNGKVDRLPSIE